MEYMKYSFGYVFLSERPGTLAGRKMDDDVTEETKARRLQEIVDLQQKHAWSRSEEFIGQTVEVLVEKVSKNQPKNFQEEILKA
jgi:tRNA-2-methylthio-N6-dimethylallyladenosine synthase